ncbi:MAG: MAPEG family protein [Candidatus Lindowbacteria bacterium]|nr:MAPEG family protein [Candidatus Lindowbacteria bacterium]
MTTVLSSELYWLVLVTLMTALIWVPYIINRIVEEGLWTALKNPNPDTRPNAQWAFRAEAAHKNAVENLVVFAALVLALQMTEAATPMTAMAAMIFFYARAAHLVVYVLGIPLVRTIVFFIGFLAQMVMGLTVLGMM